MITRSDVANNNENNNNDNKDVTHLLAALSHRLEVHSTTPGQNSAYGACHSSGSLCLRGRLQHL